MHERRAARADTRTEIPGDEVLLAATRRAALHDPRGRGRTPIWTLLEHLDIPRRTAQGRAVRARLLALERRGWLEQRSARGVPTWALTASGTRHLTRAERAGGKIVLPESPQHRAWRQARMLAAEEIERFAERLRDSSAETARLAQGDRLAEVPSDRWLELGARLARDARLLASARHCLSEWPEPDESCADIDTLSSPGDEQLGHDRLRALRLLRAGRRNTLLWREPD
jgi:hypothetical protein